MTSKQPGVAAELLNLVAQHGIANPSWETLLNRRGTGAACPLKTQASVTDQASAFALMLSHPSLIKRPVLVWPHTITVGFAQVVGPHLAALPLKSAAAACRPQAHNHMIR